jgi:hypothetical protein
MFPEAQDRDALNRWLVEAAGIAPDRVITVTATTATAVVSPLPPRAAGGDVTLRAEALTQEAAARGGVLAWQVKVAVDCRGGRVRLGATTGFPDRHAATEGVELAPAEADWRTPAPGTPLHDAWRAVCDPAFRPPLSEALVTAASAPQPQPASAPLPEAGPEPPAAPAPAPTSRPALPKPSAAKPPAARVAPGPAIAAEAQVLSSSSQDGTRRGLAAVSGRFAAAFVGRKTRIEVATVGGRMVYRGLVTGFDSRADLAGFCRTLKTGGQDCLVRE